MDTEVKATLNYLGRTWTISLPKSFDQLVSTFNTHFNRSCQAPIRISYHKADKSSKIKLRSENDYRSFASFLHRNAILEVNLFCAEGETKEKKKIEPLSKGEAIAQRFYFMKVKDKVFSLLKRKAILQRQLVFIIRRGYTMQLLRSFQTIKDYSIELKVKEEKNACSFDNDTQTNSFESIMYIESVNQSFEFKNNIQTFSIDEVSFIQSKEAIILIEEDYDYLFLQEIIILLDEKKIKYTNQQPIVIPLNSKKELPNGELDTEIPLNHYPMPTIHCQLYWVRDDLIILIGVLEIEDYWQPGKTNDKLFIFLEQLKVKLRVGLICKSLEKIKVTIRITPMCLDVSIYILLTYLNLLFDLEKIEITFSKLDCDLENCMFIGN